ncbi:MAG: adenylyl-sulfate kinase [Phycisphaerae bacterium]|nr:adenylyl-sulfate kinase [Phycisphaerae bacterium]
MERSDLSQPVVWSDGLVQRADRSRRLGHGSATVWLTGRPSSGKSTIGAALEQVLLHRGVLAYRVDGDNLRHGLNADLGFTAADRAENVRRAGEACVLLADAGLVVIACFVSPYLSDRALVRERHARAGIPFLEVFVDAPLEVAEARDPKGQYRKAREGKIPSFTGIDSPYEPPERPELWLPTTEVSVAECVTAIVARLFETIQPSPNAT